VKIDKPHTKILTAMKSAGKKPGVFFCEFLLKTLDKEPKKR